MKYSSCPIILALVSLTSDLGELKDNVLASELAVDLAEGIDLVVNTSTLLGIKEDLDNLMAILLRAYTLADDLGGVDKVTEDSVMDGGESSVAGTLLLDARAAAGKGEDAALSDEDNVAVGELLLELTGESLLHLVEPRQERDGHKDHNSLLSIANFNLSSTFVQVDPPLANPYLPSY